MVESVQSGGSIASSVQLESAVREVARWREVLGPDATPAFLELAGGMVSAMTRERVDIAVIGTVGGVGATTLSVALAAVAARRGETVELAESPAALSYCANGRPTGMTWGDYGAPMDGCTVSLAVGDVPGDQVVVVVDASVHGVREARWALWRDVVIVVRTHDGSLTVETVAEVLGYRVDKLVEWADRRSVRLANDAGIMATHTPASLVKVAELVLDRVMVEVAS